MFRLSRPTRRLVAVLTSATLAVTGLTVTGLVTVGATSASASDSDMFGQVNASRASRGLDAYAWNSHLADVALEQAQRMAKKKKLYHNPNLASDVGNYRWVGENVGYGPSSNVIQKAFMNSPAHKANIVDDNYTQIGIASVRDGGGRLWVAQVFRQPSGGSDSGSSSKAKSKSKSKAKAKSTPKVPSRDTAGDDAPKTVKKRTTTTTSRSDNAEAPRPTRTATPRPKTSTPAPEPTLAQRVDYATANHDSTATDPLADAFAFAETMNAIGG